EPLGKLRVRACPDQAGKLVAWAQAWPERTWAVEGARGLGRLPAQQLAAAGERVLDAQPKLAARVRLPEAGDTNKTDRTMPGGRRATEARRPEGGRAGGGGGVGAGGPRGGDRRWPRRRADGAGQAPS